MRVLDSIGEYWRVMEGIGAFWRVMESFGNIGEYWKVSESFYKLQFCIENINIKIQS